MSGGRGLPTRFAVAFLIVGLFWAIWLTNQQASNTHEENRRLAAHQVILAEQQHQLAIDQHTLAVQQRALVQERNDRLLSNCEAANEQANHAVTESLLLANREIPEPRSPMAQAFVSTYVGAVIDANPQRDCSPPALHLEPLPPVPPLAAATGGGGATGATPSTRGASGHPPPSGAATTICVSEGKSGRCHRP